MLRSIAFLSTLMFVFGCGNQPESSINETEAGAYGSNIVLTVGERTVTEAMLASSLEQAHGDSQLVNMKLEALISRLMILQDASSRGFDSTPEMELFAAEREREKLQNDWLTWILDQKVQLPPDTIEEYYSQMGTMLIYRGISVRDRALCDSLRQLVLAGANMGDLVAQYSTNPPEAGNRGVYGPVDLLEISSWDSPLLQGLEVGELSLMDSSRSGWRFLRIDSVYQDTLPPLNEIREIVGSRILGRLKMAYKEELFDSLRTANNLQIEEGIPELIADHFLENSMEYDPFTSEQEDMVAYTYLGGERSLHAFVENISNLPPMSENAPGDPDWIAEYSQLLGLYDIMAMEARKLEMDTLPGFVSFMDQRVGNRVLDIYYSEVIEPRLSPTEDELREIYEVERDSMIIPEERTFRTMSAIGDDQLDLLRQVMESGRDPYSMIEEFTSVPGLLAPGESLITVPMKASGIPDPYSEMLFNAEMYETVICSLAVDRVLVFEVIEISPEHVATFEESREQITKVFMSAEEEEVISVLVDSLHSVYHTELDSEFVDRFIYADSSSSIE